MENESVYSLYCSVIALWSSVLCGKQTEKQSKIYNYMKEVKIGDFVFESSSGFLAVKAWNAGNKQEAADHLRNMFGTLEEISYEEFKMDDKTKKEYVDSGEKIPVEKVYYIKNLHGIRFRWHNASFLRVPSEYI